MVTRCTILLLGLMLISACKKKNATLTDFGYNYFPLIEGQYIAYNVVDITHDVDLNPQHDTSRYQLKVTVGEEIIDNEGDIGFKIYRSQRLNSTDNWVQTDVWSAKRTNTTAEVVEENVRITKLIFAAKVGKTWDANYFNIQDEEIHEIIEINALYNSNGFVFDSTCTVQILDFFSLVDDQQATETYAKNIGLVNLSYKNNRINNFDINDIEKGEELYHTIFDYGVE